MRDKASESNEDMQQYVILNVNHRLQDISLPNDIVHCTEPCCHNHPHDLDTHCNIRQFVIVLFSLQMNVNSHCKHVAGWNESACLWKWQLPSGINFGWIVHGYPSVEVTAAIRKKTKQCYKAEARRRLRRQKYVRREKKCNALAANCSRDFRGK